MHRWQLSTQGDSIIIFINHSLKQLMIMLVFHNIPVAAYDAILSCDPEQSDILQVIHCLYPCNMCKYF